MKRKFDFWPAAALCALLLVVLGAACKAGDGAGGERAGVTSKTTTAPPSSDVALQGATPHPTSTPNDGVRRVSVEETQKLADAGRAVIVDVRNKANYDQGHIKGSISVPRTEIDRRLDELPKDKLLIFYCA